MTKIVGVSFGTKNGNNDTICKAVLLAAQKQGCEVEFIRAMDLDIKHCTGCITCVKMLMSGTKNMCVHKDDFDWLAYQMFRADGVVMAGGTSAAPFFPTRRTARWTTRSSTRSEPLETSPTSAAPT
jgi:multimeric flavodoxin WrbA